MPALLKRAGVRTSLASYAALRERVRETFSLGQRKIEAVKVRAYWQVGRFIHRHLLLHKARAGYGDRVIQRLAQDLSVHSRLLHQILKFYRRFPKIVHGRAQLTWSHYRELAEIDDRDKREAFAELTVKKKWTAEELERRNKKRAEVKARPVELLVPKKGKLGIYRIVEDGGKLSLDRGFTSYVELTEAEAKSFKAGDLVRALPGEAITLASDAKVADLYTYEAELRALPDADTYWMKIWLRRPDWLREKLRLRGVDAPEIGTPEGQAAKRFVQKLFRQALKITITTTKPDKWDRYLSDVFLTMPKGDDSRAGDLKISASSPQSKGIEEIFLNNLLLEKGFARRYDQVKPRDWDES